jgi:HAD superfamily hydrolase (TIGR01490 family)
VSRPHLTLFDLDETLLSGDSDALWCDLLMARGLLDRAEFASRNADMQARYSAGTASAQDFAGFYVSTLAGRSPASLEALRQDLLRECIVPRIPPAAVQLVHRHLDSGDRVVMTTATNRFITELTAQHFGIEHLIATESEMAHGVFTGRPAGTLNMREGKVVRLHDWLRARGETLQGFHSRAYSDSINDLPLLEAVQEPVAVDPDARLAAVAAQRRWRVIRLR